MTLFQDLDLRARFTIEDALLSQLHARAFGYSSEAVKSWATRLHGYTATTP